MLFDLGCVFSFSGFVFDPESGELAHNGVRVRLGKQTADILAVLILNAGSLVTRQRLRELLWPGGELVNHEKIINNGISRLRYIFKDDPLVPTFIERVPKRGYRWIMPVERIGRAVASPSAPPDRVAQPERQDELPLLESLPLHIEVTAGESAENPPAPRQ